MAFSSQLLALSASTVALAVATCAGVTFTLPNSSPEVATGVPAATPTVSDEVVREQAIQSRNAERKALTAQAATKAKERSEALTQTVDAIDQTEATLQAKRAEEASTPPPPPAPTPTPTPSKPAPPKKPVPTPSKPAPTPGGPVSEETVILDLLNEKRAAAGLKPLAMSSEISDFARSWSADMSTGGFRHNPNFGRMPGSCRAMAENIAMTYTPKDMGRVLFNMWWNSSGHKTNMMSPRFTRIGIGIVCVDGKGCYATQNFCE